MFSVFLFSRFSYANHAQKNHFFRVFDISAARFGNLEPFGLLFKPFGDFAWGTLKFGNFLSDFSKIVKKTVFLLKLSGSTAWY